MRRLSVLLAVVASLSLSATAIAAVNPDVWEYTGTSITVGADNFVLNEDGSGYVPGTYQVVSVYTLDGTWSSNNVPYLEEHVACATVAQDTTTGDSTSQDWAVSGCAPWTVMSLDRQLGWARLVADIPITGCTSWNPDGSCEVADWTITADLTLTGTGPITRDAWGDAFGDRNLVRITQYDHGLTRGVLVSGSVGLNGEAAMPGATWTGSIGRGSGGGVVVIH